MLEFARGSKLSEAAWCPGDLGANRQNQLLSPPSQSSILLSLSQVRTLFETMVAQHFLLHRTCAGGIVRGIEAFVPSARRPHRRSQTHLGRPRPTGSMFRHLARLLKRIRPPEVRGLLSRRKKARRVIRTLNPSSWLATSDICRNQRSEKFQAYLLRQPDRGRDSARSPGRGLSSATSPTIHVKAYLRGLVSSFERRATENCESAGVPSQAG